MSSLVVSSSPITHRRGGTDRGRECGGWRGDGPEGFLGTRRVKRWRRSRSSRWSSSVLEDLGQSIYFAIFLMFSSSADHSIISLFQLCSSESCCQVTTWCCSSPTRLRLPQAPPSSAPLLWLQPLTTPMLQLLLLLLPTPSIDGCVVPELRRTGWLSLIFCFLYNLHI